MRLILLSTALLIVVIVLTAVVVLRRGTGQELLSAQMRTIGDPQPARSKPTGSPAGVDDATWRRIGELALSGRRVQAIELLRATTGCRLTEAKAVVDRLTRRGAPSGDGTGMSRPDAETAIGRLTPPDP